MNPWKSILKDNFTRIDALLDYLEFSSENRQLVMPRSRFVLNLPRRIAAKMKKNDPSDPLFLQFVPLVAEGEWKPDDLIDPVGDCHAQKTGKFLHKYQGRALLMPTSACAMHCRCLLYTSPSPRD